MAVPFVFKVALPRNNFSGAAPNFGSGHLLNGSGYKAAWIGHAPKTGNIRNVQWRNGVTTTPTDTNVRIETVDLSTGDPSGTLWGTNTNVTVGSGSISNAWIRSGNLTAVAAVVEGDLIAVVLAPTGTPNYTSFIGLPDSSSENRFSYWSTYNGAVWAKNFVVFPAIALEYDDGTFAFMDHNVPITSYTTNTIGNGSTPDEVAALISIPVTATLTGIEIELDADGDFDIVVYDTDGSTPLSTTSFDKDVRGITSPGLHSLKLVPAQLQAGSTYRVSVKPSSATSLSIYSFNVNSADLLDCLPGGQDIAYSSRVDAGAWTDVATRRVFMNFVFDDITASGSGGSANLLRPGLVIS